MPRGRPRKNPVVIKVEQLESNTEQKKRRGRPRKSELNTTNNPSKKETYSNNTYKLSGVKKKEPVIKDKVAVSENIELVDVGLHPLPLFMLEMCKLCSNDCKVSAVKGATMIKCPDFEQKQ